MTRKINIEREISYNIKLKEYINELLELAVLVVFGVIIFWYYLNITMIENVTWKQDMYDKMVYWLEWLVGFKFFSDLWIGKYNIKKLVFVAVELCVLLTSYHTTESYTALLIISILVVGMNGVNYKKIAIAYLLASVPITIYTIASSLFGTVIDLTHYRTGHIRHAFGFIYPTDFATCIMFILIAWVVIREKRIGLVDALVVIAVAAWLKKYCDARCTVMALLLLAMWILILINAPKFHSANVAHYYRSFKLQSLATIVPWIFAGMLIILGQSSIDNGFTKVVDKLTSGRVRLTREAFSKYSIKAFGQYIKMNGNGGKTAEQIYKKENYFFIDSSYANVVLRYGLLVLLIALIIMSILILKTCDNLLVFGILLIVCIHCVIEHHLMDVYNNFWIVLPLADFSRNIRENRT